MQDQRIPVGFCQCGCGERTRRVEVTNRPAGYNKGQYRRYIHGHHARGKRFRQGPDYIIDPATGCWEWQHGKDASGYGKLRAEGRDWLAYRWYYRETRGSLPENGDLDHLCRNPGCINADHLEHVSHGENCRRGSRAKLTWSDVHEIRASSATYQVLADRYGVTSGAISNVKNFKRWVPDDWTPEG